MTWEEYVSRAKAQEDQAWVDDESSMPSATLLRRAIDDLSAALCVWRSTWGEGEEGEVAEEARKYVLERIRAAEIAKDPNFDTIGDWF